MLSSLIDQINEFLSHIEPILLVVIPAMYGIYLKVRSSVNEVNKITTAKNKLRYDAWKHERSRMVIFKIKEQCNYYKDRSNAEHVFFLQLENGTVATSKIYNMYLTCLAEDNRYGDNPKVRLKLQRIPYSQVAEWFEASQNKIYVNAELADANSNWPQSLMLSEIKTIISTGVRDKEGFMVGLAVFTFSDSFAADAQAKQMELMKEFKAAIETTFLNYCVECQDKQNELGLKEAI